jgi:hypothetical protein
MTSFLNFFSALFLCLISGSPADLNVPYFYTIPIIHKKREHLIKDNSLALLICPISNRVQDVDECTPSLAFPDLSFFHFVPVRRQLRDNKVMFL